MVGQSCRFAPSSKNERSDVLASGNRRNFALSVGGSGRRATPPYQLTVGQSCRFASSIEARGQLDPAALDVYYITSYADLRIRVLEMRARV